LARIYFFVFILVFLFLRNYQFEIYTIACQALRRATRRNERRKKERCEADEKEDEEPEGNF
jgi:hypothetical protein